MHRFTRFMAIALTLLASGSAIAVATAGAKRGKPQSRGHKSKPKKAALRLTRIHCGMVVTKSIKVANDITCDVPANAGMPPMPGMGAPPVGHVGTPADGLVVARAHGITIDLNGHTLRGPRVPGVSADLTIGHSVEMIGIQLLASNHVTITNGKIEHFDAGVADTHGNHNHLYKLTVADNQNYETVNGAIDYLPPTPNNDNPPTVTPTGTGTASYTYELATAQAPSPATTPGDNGAGGSSLNQDSLPTSASKAVTNSDTLSSTSFNTITFTGATPGAYATGYRVLRSVNGGPYVWVGTALASAATNSYTFVDQGQAPAQAAPYKVVSLDNNNVSVNDTCDNGDGIVIDASSYDMVDHNVATDNGPFSGIAMVGEYNGTSYDGAGHNTITDNRLSHNAVLNTDAGYNNPRNVGMSAYCGTGAGGGGMTRGRGVQDSGIRLEGPDAQYNMVSFNQVSGSGFNGIAIHSYVCQAAVSAMGGTPQPNGVPNSFNTILGNTVWDTGRYTPAGAETNLDGIGFLASGPANVVCVSGNNKVMKNNVLANRRDGIFVGGRANSGNLIVGNSARGNWRNGITASLGGPGWGNPPNQFMQNSGSANGAMDATDMNPNCAGDVWSANTFAKVAPACVK